MNSESDKPPSSSLRRTGAGLGEVAEPTLRRLEEKPFPPALVATQVKTSAAVVSEAGTASRSPWGRSSYDWAAACQLNCATYVVFQSLVVRRRYATPFRSG